MEQDKHGDSPDLETLLQDIQAMKSALHRHDRLIRQILLPKYFGLMSAYFGAALLLIFGSFQVLISMYGSYAAIPPMARYVLWALLIFAMISSSIIKLMSFSRASKELSGPNNIFALMREFFILPLRHVYIGSAIGSILVSVYLAMAGLALLIIPVVVLIIGIIWNQLGEFIKSRSYLIVGYWLILSGGLSFFFVQAYPYAVLALSPGLGFLMFGSLGLWEGHQDRKGLHG